MEIQTITTGYLEENCYLLIHGDSCLVVDPGGEYGEIRKSLKNYQVLGVLITHHHFDHVGALEPLLEEYHTSIYDINSIEKKEYSLGPFHFQIMGNPGHSKDSVRFVFKVEKVMFVGDFVFYHSIGRTDLPGGDSKEMVGSLNQLKKETENYTLYPGHGPKTTLEEEKKNNPYF